MLDTHNLILMSYPLYRMAVKIQNKYKCDIEFCNFLTKTSQALHGFVFCFPNGYKLSVQFSWGHYCDNYIFVSDTEDTPYDFYLKSTNAEIAVIDKKGLMSIFRSRDTVRGYLTPEQIMRYANKINQWEQINHAT